jgi:hypothetical protein
VAPQPVPGWWQASDGQWYPAHLHPDEAFPRHQRTDGRDLSTVTMGPTSRFKRLPYGGVCLSCGARIERNAEGWHDPVISKVTCVNSNQSRECVRLLAAH